MWSLNVRRLLRDWWRFSWYGFAYSGGPVLRFLAAGPNSDGIMALQVSGVGTPTCTHASTIYAPDKDGVYQSFTTNKPVWGGGRYVDEDTVYNTESDGETLLNPQPYLLYLPALTNSQIRSNDLADVEWTATNVTVGDQDETGIRNLANEACTLTATAANGTVIANAITAASATHSTAWHIKRKTGTGTIELTVDGGTTWQDITSSVTASFARITVDQVTVTNPQIGIRIVTSGDAVIVGNAECHLTQTLAEVREAGPIFTTTGAVSTDRIDYKFNIDNHNDSSGAYFFECYLERGDVAGSVVNGGILNISTIGFVGLYYWANAQDTLRSYDGTTATSINSPGLTLAWRDFALVYSTTDELSTISVESSSAEGNYDGSWDFQPQVSISLFVSSIYPQKIRNLQRWQGGTYAQLKAKVTELMA